MTLNIKIASMTQEHWPAVRNIFAQGIGTGNATFETTVPTWEEWDARHLPTCRLVAVHDDRVAGWGALSPVSNRHVYRGVAEVSVYVAESARRQGVGASLLVELVESSERAGIWTLQAGILVENAASLRLHSMCGFREVGVRKRIGSLNGRWRDTVLMERRSQTVGL